MSKIVNKNIVKALLLIALIVFSVALIYPSTKQNSYASVDAKNWITQKSSMVNNVVLFAFKDREAQVVDEQSSSGYTENVYNFVNDFNYNFNQSPTSIKTYYSRMSNGNFTINSNLVKYENGDPLVIVLDRDFDYYNTNNKQVLINDILDKLSNFSTTIIVDESADNNQDEYIDSLTFISLDFVDNDYLINNNYTLNDGVTPSILKYANSFQDTIVWPHALANENLNANALPAPYNYYKRVIIPSFYFDTDLYSSYSYSNYFQSVYIHEMGHILGFPDLYVQEDGNSNDYVDAWDLMSTNQLQSLNSYFKQKAGWLNNSQFVEIASNGDYTLIPSNYNESQLAQGQAIDLTSPLAYYIVNPNDSKQFIVLEYKHLENEYGYDNNLINLDYNSGLLVYRVNENKDTENYKLIDSNHINNASIFVFKNGSAISNATLKATESIGTIEESKTTQSEINTNFISFENTDGEYVNSNIKLTITSLNDNGITFTVESDFLSNTPAQTPNVELADIITDDNYNLVFSLAKLGYSNPRLDEITLQDLQTKLQNIDTLDLKNAGITDLTGLASILGSKVVSNITTIILNNNKITNGFEELTNFTNLVNLQLMNCELDNIDFISDTLNDLQYINLAINNIKEFSPINRTQKQKLKYVNLALNNLDFKNSNNTFLFNSAYNGIYDIGIQNLPTTPYIIGLTQIYYNQDTNSKNYFLLQNNGVIYDLENGYNTLDAGTYELEFRFSNEDINFESVFKFFDFEIIIITLKTDKTELLVGETYNEDLRAPNQLFNGWKNSPYYSYEYEITKDEVITNEISSNDPGKYKIIFTITISDDNSFSTSFTLEKIVTIYRNDKIEFGENGIKDERLYTQLLNLVGKQADIIDDTIQIGVSEENSLYAQDLYFYDITNENNAPITELNFSSKGIKDLTGILLLNLSKIELINFNMNDLESIEPLFPSDIDSSITFPSLKSLNLANVGISELPTNIGYLTNLEKLDLSFNSLVVVDALKPLMNAKIQLVNLNMNNLVFYKTEDADYEEANGFTREVRPIDDTSNKKYGDEVFIILIQELPEYASYTDNVTFSYFPTSANTYTSGNTKHYKFDIKVLGNSEFQTRWANMGVSATFTNAGVYNITFGVNGTNPFALTSFSKFSRTFYFSKFSMKTLSEINKDKGNNYYTFKDDKEKWDSENTTYTILSTELINYPSISDLILEPASQNPDYSGFKERIYYTAIENNVDVDKDLSKDQLQSFISGTDFKDRKNNEFYVMYTLSVKFENNNINYLPASSGTQKYTVKIVRNNIVNIDKENTALINKLKTILKKSDNDIKWCSDLYERHFSGYNGNRVNVRYDDCNLFGMIAGDFGDITKLTKHTTKTAFDSTINEINNLSDFFASFMRRFNIESNGTVYIPEINNDALNSYTQFYNKAMEIYNNTLVSFTKNLNTALTQSALIGINNPYTMTFGTDIDPTIVDYQSVIANLFGFSSKDEFTSYAQLLAEMYQNYRNGEVENEAILNGCFEPKNDSFVFPIAIKNDSNVVLAYVIIDSNNLVSVWVNDIESVLWMINYNSDFHTNGTINNRLYCKDILFITGPDILYEYDTYRINKFDLSNAGLESIDGIEQFNLQNITNINLSNNNLTSISALTNTASDKLKSLKYLDISFNNLTDSSELRQIKVDHKLYVLAFMNMYKLLDPEEDDYAQNSWLITENAKSGNIEVFVGIQGINSNETYFITNSNKEINAQGSKAGFYFIDKNIKETAGYKEPIFEGTSGPVSSDPTSRYTYYYYYTDAKNYGLTFNFNFEEFNFKYQGIVHHLQLYADNTNITVGYDKTDSQETIDNIINLDCLIYSKNCQGEEFNSQSVFYKGEEEITLEDIHINELTEFEQSVIVEHAKTGYKFLYKKYITVKDLESPVLRIPEDSLFIQTYIYNYNLNSRINDIEVSDNYDSNIDDIKITTEIRDGKNNLLKDNNGENIVSIPVDKPDVYTITYYATDTSGNVSEKLVRTVQINYTPFDNIKVTKPEALVYVGKATFKATVYINDTTKDPDPIFTWYIDGERYVWFDENGERHDYTTKDSNLESATVISSTLKLPIDTAGKHIIEVRVNEDKENNAAVTSEVSTVEYFVLLDNNAIIVLIIVVSSLTVLIVTACVIFHIRKKKRIINNNKYEYNLVSKDKKD